MKIQITGGKVLMPEGFRNTALEIENERITKIGRLKVDTSAHIISADNMYVLPGFIDLHTNGIAGFDLTNGLYNPEKDNFIYSEKHYLRGLETALKQYAKHGTTLVGFTMLEASIKKMKRIFHLIAKYKRESTSLYKNVLYGIYMEGTFMKDKGFRGAHNPKYFFKPSVNLFKELQEAADGNIKIVNVVPEWEEDALDLISYLRSKNIISAAGHTSATGEQFNSAIKRGLTLAIHVLNGPLSSSFKPFGRGGALESILQSDDIFVEIIADGYHVDKAYLLDIVKKKGPGKCAIITDSMFVTDMQKIRQFRMSGIGGKISQNIEYLQIAGRETDNLLFGSLITMDVAFSNLITWLTKPIKGIWNNIHNPMSLDDAIAQASEMCSATPAKILGIYNSNGNNTGCTGSIEHNKFADIIVADIYQTRDGYKIKIEDVLLKGNLIKRT